MSESTMAELAEALAHAVHWLDNPPRTALEGDYLYGVALYRWKQLAVAAGVDPDELDRPGLPASTVPAEPEQLPLPSDTITVTIGSEQ
jgi:hypothetical protein